MARSSPDTGLVLSLSSPTTGLANVDDSVRIDIEADGTTVSRTCLLRETGEATCLPGSAFRVRTTMAGSGRVFEIELVLTSHPAHVKATLRNGLDGTRIAGPRETDVTYPTLSEACGCQGTTNMGMTMGS